MGFLIFSNLRVRFIRNDKSGVREDFNEVFLGLNCDFGAIENLLWRQGLL